ncbi:heterokaryon incompatibility protein-domain-containing protein [Apiospora marii]|uniref:Heterokaryon incompatibility protein-domain-containing protein n=1 Tax=Apiospora marii TaxID=335849 RepID=A0ABR1R4Q2_9PEZI
MELIRQWLESCHDGHPICQPTRVHSNSNPVRLIDVDQQTVVESSLEQRYIALSYIGAPMLFRNTLSRYSSPNGLVNAPTPQTISDAIQLVQNLGERYLWVDSLCIVQDDANDKLEQLPIMGNVYRQAYLVIVAAAGNDAHAGLPGMRDTVRREWQPTEIIKGVRFAAVRPSLDEALKRTTWDSRGWTFQEMTLARRILVFTERQIYYSCGTQTMREDASLERALDTNDIIRPDEIQFCRTRTYCHHVSQFSRRHFKEDGDILWAFMGILELHTARFQSGFIWGLPYERLDATLLWSDIGTCPNVHVRDVQHNLALGAPKDRIKFPSWSWLSSYGGVKFKDPCGDSVVSEVHWKKPILAENNGTRLAKSSESILEYGLIRCTAKTANIRPRATRVSESDGVKELLPFWVEATMPHTSGERMGTIFVTDAVFDGGEEQSGEFILLSSNAEGLNDATCVEDTDGLDCGNIQHVPGCKHIKSYNVMLIQWDDGIAYRRGLATINKGDWASITTYEKHIVLG